MQLNVMEKTDGQRMSYESLYNLEILFFLPPKSTIDFEVSLDKESYSPGD
jgi:hypothetical protein